MIKTLILLTVFLFSTSLIAQDIDIKDKLIPKEKIGVHGRNFKLNGFYSSKQIRLNSKSDTTRSIAPCFFYKNGLYLGFDNFSVRDRTEKGRTRAERKKGIECIMVNEPNFKSIIEFFKCYSEIVDINSSSIVYSIDKNSIRIQNIDPNYNIFFEQYGVVYNDSTFVITKTINHITNEIKEKSAIYHFQASQKPDSTKMKPNSTIKKYFFR